MARSTTTPHMPLLKAYPFASNRGLGAEIATIRELSVRRDATWPYAYTSSVRRGYVIELLKRKNLFDTFAREHWPVGLTAAGKSRINAYFDVRERWDRR